MSMLALALFGWHAQAMDPANDDCASAELLPVNEGGGWGWECFNGVDGTTEGATDDGGAAACFDGGPYADVWYRFHSGDHTSVSYHLFWYQYIVPPGYGGLVVEVFEGECGGNVVHCATGLSAMENALETTPGTDYWIRVASTLGNEGAFFLCLNALPVPPDPCDNIVEITGCGWPTGPQTTWGPGVWSWPELDGDLETPGRERLFTFTPEESGAYRIEVTEYFGGYQPGTGTGSSIGVEFFWKEADACGDAGWNHLGGIMTEGFIPWSGPGMMLTEGVTYYIMWDAQNRFGRIVDFTINCLTPPYDPCGSIMDISCGVPTGPQVAEPGPGGWSSDGPDHTPGREHIFRFTPERSGTHGIHVSEYIGDGDVDFLWKEADACDAANWNYFGWHTGTGDVELSWPGDALMLTAGVEYYIMWDPHDVEGRTIDLTLLCPDCTDEPGGTALPGADCDDGDPDTVDDAYTADCECVGMPVEWDCPELHAHIGDMCDDGDPDTENDVVTVDCECVGTPIASAWDCPDLAANIGDDCDDGNPATVEDVITEECECEGDILDGIRDRVAGAGVRMSVHPNPNSSGLVTIEATGLPATQATALIKVLDRSGKLVQEREVALNNGVLLYQMDLAGHVSTGLYAVRVLAGELQLTRRLSVVR